MDSDLTTANLADACLRAQVPMRCLPLTSTMPGGRIQGPAIVVRHFGSVDVFLEAMWHAEPGGVLVIDNAARNDESCIGDLIGIEGKLAGVTGMVVWGFHRDTSDLRAMQMSVFSLGTMPAGPARLDPRVEPVFGEATIGSHRVVDGDYVVADDDGVIFLPCDRLADIELHARRIHDVETAQAERARAGQRLSDQLGLAEYVAARDADPSLTFRKHLRAMAGAIEE